MKPLLISILGLLLLFMACAPKEESMMDISGEWRYQLDPGVKGESEKWYATDLVGKIALPGALRDYNIGNEPDLNTNWTGSIYDSSWYYNPDMAKYRVEGNMKFPFWLTPDKHYVGKAWYQKQVQFPKEWEGKDVILNLERPHWQTSVWLDTILLGKENSLSVPHTFVIPSRMVKEGIHNITICVDNAIRNVDPGINSHSITDHTQGNWNGITGKMQLIPKHTFRFSVINIRPDPKNKKVLATILFNGSASDDAITLRADVKGLNHSHTLPEITKTLSMQNDSITLEIPMGEAFKTWSEFSPDLYELKLTLSDKNGVLDRRTETFGMREFTVNGNHFEINGIPLFLRGTTECCVFPLTGYPPTEEAEWAHIFEVCESFGLNHMRFHSYCPPEAAFIAADKAGIYLQVEGPSWAKYSTSLGYGKPIDAYLMEETRRIIDAYGNHPSFCMMAYGNEPSGRYVGYLENWVDYFRSYDPQRVFTGASTGRSWAIIENSDFIVRSPPRGLNWKNTQPESEFDYRNKTENQERPYVTFEMGQWCAFPNFEEIKKYTGSLKAKNFELFQEDLNDHHMGAQAKDFLMASGKLQASCYKQEIEATLRTPNLAGFQLLSLNDFSGQGTALVGVLDAFWDEKGYVTAEEFRSFCNDVVPLARLPKFTFESDDTLKANVEIANFSGKELSDDQVKWRFANASDSMVKKGVFPLTNIPIGHGNVIGSIKFPLDFIDCAEKYTLSVTVGAYQNSWNIWIYPADPVRVASSDIIVVQRPDNAMKKALQEGKNVLLLGAGNIENGKDVVQYQTPVFWNTSWFKMRPPHTTGILIQEEHPVFKDFPTDYYSDHQWWEIGNRPQIMNLENFPADFKPLVQPIDTWFLNRRLALMFEAHVEKGSVLVCSMDLERDLANRPVARQLRQSIVNYMQSGQFQPEKSINIETIEELFEKKERKAWNAYVNKTP